MEVLKYDSIGIILKGFKDLKQIRELLYDISIAIFNQWKGHKNVIDFRVEIDINRELKINVIYNENVQMNKILYQTYLNQNYISAINIVDWDGENDTEKDNVREEILGFTQGLDESKLKSIAEIIEAKKQFFVLIVEIKQKKKITKSNLKDIAKNNINIHITNGKKGLKN